MNKEEETEAKGSQWKISKIGGNRTTYIHIIQALKLILPREYIARCHQKRHWAAKYLPGKVPVDPKHDLSSLAMWHLSPSNRDRKSLILPMLMIFNQQKMDHSAQVSN